MPKAVISMPTGAKIIVEGTPNEIQTIINLIGIRNIENKSEKKQDSKKKSSGIMDYVLDLRDEGFFKKARSLKEIRNALAAAGHIIPRTTLSPAMLRLVKNRELRRLKEEKNWKYVNR